jgi:hypothetical protein
MRITSQVDPRSYPIVVGGMPRGGCHGQPRLSLHGVARYHGAHLDSLGWRPLLETLRCLEGRSIPTGKRQDCGVEEMREQTRSNQSWNGRTVTMIPTISADCTKKISDIVARRAFQISEARGFTPGHEMEDWKRAESELVSPICGGWTLANDKIVVTATASLYKEGAIEICVEPRRLAVFGRQRTSTGHNMPAKDRYNTQEKEIVRILELPVEIDPSGATARFDHCMLEMSLPKARSFRGIGADSRAA